MKAETIKDETIDVTETNEATETTDTACVADSNEVDKVIRNHVYASMGTGIVPLPALDFVAVTGIQLDMVRKLSDLYGIEFKEGIAKKIITTVVGSGAGTLASPLVETAVVGIPLIGLPLAIATRPLLFGTGTYAVGQMFVTHFERGGTFLSANMDAMKESFSTAMRNSREWIGKTIIGKKEAEGTEA